MVQLRLCLDDLTMLCFKAKRFVCKWQNYQKFWEKWMQTSSLDFDSKEERKEDIFLIRDIILCPFFPYQGKQWSIMLNLLLVVVDTITLKYALFLKICIFQLSIEHQQQQQQRRISWIHSQSDGFLPLAYFSPYVHFGHMKNLVLRKVKHFFCCHVLSSQKHHAFFSLILDSLCLLSISSPQCPSIIKSNFFSLSF